MKTTHADLAEKFIADEPRTDWHDETLWFVREKRDKAAHGLPEWEQLREWGSQIKNATLSNLSNYLKEFEEMPLYDLSNVPENNKSEFIESWTKTVSEQAIKIYMMFGLKSGIESMVINDATGQEFIFSFKSLPQPPKQ